MSAFNCKILQASCFEDIHYTTSENTTSKKVEISDMGKYIVREM